MPDLLSASILFRPAKQLRFGSQHERHSIDFQINGQSLLETLIQHSAGHSDYMGCIVKDFPEENAANIARLLLQAAPDTETGRVRLYQCPECWHISCGLYSVRISHSGGSYIWQSFAYESSYEDILIIDDVGPYVFEAQQYEALIEQCRTQSW